MTSVMAVTNTVSGNEKAYTYLERHLPSPTGKGLRRYRIIYVKRDGHLAEYTEDMGKASQFKGINQLHIPALFEHTVDELREIADNLRGTVELDLKDFLGLESYKPA